jgi:LmbE family N-acetylglucosaminyl deacetylase
MRSNRKAIHMKLRVPGADIYVPDGVAVAEGVARTTHLAVSAHQDDIEIMAYHGVLECFGRSDRWFMGAVVTNGSGSPRDDLYADYTDAQMMTVRRLEQKKAAFVGEYGAQAMLDYTSSQVKDAANPDVVGDLVDILTVAKPDVVYTHNLADKHDTHVSVALRVIAAIRKLPKDARPSKVYGCEVWRDLDWMADEDKVVFNVEAHENLAAALLGVFDSQICGGKRYDLASVGRRRANATYFASHGTDTSTSMSFAMDLTPLVEDDALDAGEYLAEYIERFAGEVTSRVSKFK